MLPVGLPADALNVNQLTRPGHSCPPLPIAADSGTFGQVLSSLKERGRVNGGFDGVLAEPDNTEVGLALDRIDAAAGMITIDQQVIVVDRHPVLAPPKTSASLRDVPMPRFVLDAATTHARQLGLDAHAVLCCTPRGMLLRRDYYNRNIWKPAIAAAGLAADTTFHDLRH